ncbi:hypothetical protein [Mycobacterium talmoniae]|uniref:Uncharacterized protein n=1 Tax=Mycobacterium talmoniae TaxID=1858794 RepID=A0A1S1NMS8_9MYCO|nr:MULTISPECIES: hypothetical protein [Mycobacterium]OHV05331.1 hypothetical protein BKN37_06180 [Mycobacterium talmoniae]TDH48401.1 hypothetical protein E2F47_23820 [Mycobacterium eburneum]
MTLRGDLAGIQPHPPQLPRISDHDHALENDGASDITAAVWDALAVRKFAQGWRRKPGRPRTPR